MSDDAMTLSVAGHVLELHVSAYVNEGCSRRSAARKATEWTASAFGHVCVNRVWLHVRVCVKPDGIDKRSTYTSRVAGPDGGWTDKEASWKTRAEAERLVGDAVVAWTNTVEGQLAISEAVSRGVAERTAKMEACVAEARAVLSSAEATLATWLS